MTLPLRKFMIGTEYGCCGHIDQVDIRCTLCGKALAIDGGLRLDDAVEWAEQHECAPLAVT